MSIVKEFDTKLAGLPDNILSFILVSIGLFAIGIAFFGSATFKAILAAWLLLP